MLGVGVAAQPPLEEDNCHIGPCLVDEAIAQVVECLGVLWGLLERFEEFCVLAGPQHAADLACSLQGVHVGRVCEEGVQQGSERWSELALSDLVDGCLEKLLGASGHSDDSSEQGSRGHRPSIGRAVIRDSDDASRTIGPQR